jgi:hypothetical protein
VQIVGNEQPRYLIRLQSDAIGNCKKCDVALRRLATDIGLYSLAASTNYLLGVFIPIVVLSQVEPKDSPQTSLGRLYSLATAHRRRTLDHWLSQWPSVAAPIAERLEAGDIASNRSLSFRDVRSCLTISDPMGSPVTRCRACCARTFGCSAQFSKSCDGNSAKSRATLVPDNQLKRTSDSKACSACPNS